jgi:hypothetical protein
MSCIGCFNSLPQFSICVNSLPQFSFREPFTPILLRVPCPCLPNPAFELELIQTHTTQKAVLRVEVGKGRLCGLLCFSALKQQKTEEITPDQTAFLFLVETTRTIATRVLIVTIKTLLFSGQAPAVLPSL